MNTRKRLGKYRMAMIVPRYGYLAEAPVRADGCFGLDGFDFPDSTAFMLRPQATTGRMRNAFVKVDPETFPENGIPAPYPAAGAGDAEALFRTALAYVGYMGSADLRNVLIDPVEVRAKREIPRTLEERKAVYSWNAERIADTGESTRSSTASNGCPEYAGGRTCFSIRDGPFSSCATECFTMTSKNRSRHSPLRRRSTVIAPSKE